VPMPAEQEKWRKNQGMTRLRSQSPRPSEKVTNVQLSPRTLVRIPAPFDHPDWLFELKLDIEGDEINGADAEGDEEEVR
jgi:hypothetical protein